MYEEGEHETDMCPVTPYLTGAPLPDMCKQWGGGGGGGDQAVGGRVALLYALGKGEGGIEGWGVSSRAVCIGEGGRDKGWGGPTSSPAVHR